MGTPTRTSTIPLMRLGHPQAFAAFLNKVGTPTDRLYRRAALPVYCDDPRAFVPLRNAWALFDAAAQQEDPFLAWHVGKFYGDNRIGTGVKQAVECAPTLYQGLKRLIRLIRVESSQLNLKIIERPDEIVLCTSYSPKSTMKDWPGYASSQAYQISVYVDLIRHYTGPDWQPGEIGIEHPEVPEIAQEQYPHARICSGQTVGYVKVPRSCLHLPVCNAVHSTASRDQATSSRDIDFVETLKSLVRAYLPDGYPTAKKMADLLGVSRRTVYRRLVERNLSYQAVVDEVRFDAAKTLLQQSEPRIIDVARDVGFDDPAHFARTFRRIGGSSPREFRRRIL